MTWIFPNISWHPTKVKNRNESLCCLSKRNIIISLSVYSWFLNKKQNFVFLPWKLHNWYCHTERALANAPIIINRDSQLFKNYQQQRIPRRADNMGPPNPHKKRGKSGAFKIMWHYSSPPQLNYPQLHYFRSYAILNWVQKNSS